MYPEWIVYLATGFFALMGGGFLLILIDISIYGGRHLSKILNAPTNVLTPDELYYAPKKDEIDKVLQIEEIGREVIDGDVDHKAILVCESGSEYIKYLKQTKPMSWKAYCGQGGIICDMEKPEDRDIFEERKQAARLIRSYKRELTTLSTPVFDQVLTSAEVLGQMKKKLGWVMAFTPDKGGKYKGEQQQPITMGGGGE